MILWHLATSGRLPHFSHASNHRTAHATYLMAPHLMAPHLMPRPHLMASHLMPPHLMVPPLMGGRMGGMSALG